MPNKTFKKQKSKSATKNGQGFAKQKDLIRLEFDFKSFKEENTRQHKGFDEKIDLLAIKAIQNDEAHEQMIGRLDRIETIVEKTYNMLDTHMKTQIRFDHELVAVRSNVDRHEERIVTLETKPN